MREGSLFAGYKILKRLGHRSAGDVFLGLEVAGSAYASLLLLDEGDRLFELRAADFTGERGAAGRVSHDGVLRTLDAGRLGSTHFLIQEYVRGTTLAELLDGGLPVPEEDRLALARTVVAAVAAAHGAAVVHGALVPSVITLTDGHKVKVTAFGTKSVPFNPPHGFVAPERAVTGPTAAADLYAVGAAVTAVLLRAYPPDRDVEGPPRPLHELLLDSEVFATTRPELRRALATLLSPAPEAREAGLDALRTALTPSSALLAVVPHRRLDGPTTPTAAPAPTAPGDEESRLREEADTHFWRGKNLAFEGKPAQALAEFRLATAMPLAVIGSLAPTVEEEAALTVWRCGPAQPLPGSAPGSPPKTPLSVDALLEVFREALGLWTHLERESLRTVAERRLLETILVGVPDPDRRNHLFREALMRVRADVWTRREHCSFLTFAGRQREAVHERLRLAVTMVDEGLFAEALHEYREARRLDPDLRPPPRLAEAASRAEKLQVVAAGVLTTLDGAGAAAVPAAEHFLERLPGNVDVIERLAEVKARSGAEDEALHLRQRAAGILYNRRDWARALKNAALVLDREPCDLEALALAVDILHRRGLRPEADSLRETARRVLLHRNDS